MDAATSSTPLPSFPFDRVRLEWGRGKVRAALFGGAPTGLRVGRYVLEQPIGSGAHGTVYAAHDPELRRRVAIKIVALPKQRDRQAKALREAHALGRLAHPNVVAVHDVGRLERGPDGGTPSLYIVMEHIEGASLQQWIHRARPRRQAIVDAFTQAAFGLHAAHEAGLCHADVKPDNLLRGDDGRVRVADFGLAHLWELDKHGAGAGSGRGSLRGTPAYMAPELLAARADGGPARPSPRSDQYALCVALLQGLTGALQPDATILRRVPRALRDPLQRGLSPQPHKRWPSMHAFATALQATRRRRNWRRAATVVLGGAAALAALPRPPPCSPPEFGTTWNGDTQIALREAQVPAPVIHTITQWVARWEQTGRAACDGYVVDPQQAQRRMECLHRARLQLSATVQTLAANAERAAMHGHLALSALGEPTECIGDRARRWGDGPDAFSGELAKARAWRALGEPQRARDALQTTVQQCRDAAQSYACAELHLALAEAESSSGKLDQAAAHLEEAWQAGESHDDPFIKAQASARLAHLEGVQRDRYDLGEQWARIATASIGRLFDPGDALMAYVEHARGRIAERRGDHSAALTHLERAIAHARRAPTYRLLGLPVALDAMGRALARAERIPEAVAAFEEAIEIRAGQLGGTHPRVALSRVGLASVLNLAGQLEEAGARFDAAIGDLERRLGEDHPLLAAPYNNRGRLHADAGRLELAAVDLERALRIRAAAPRTTTWALSRSHLNLAAVYAELGDAASAQPHLRAADELLPAASPERALWHEHRATLALQSGSWGAAQTELDRAEAMVATLPQRDPQRVSLALNRVLALQSAGRPDEARQNLGRIARTCEGRCEHALQQRLLKIGAGIPK